MTAITFAAYVWVLYVLNQAGEFHAVVFGDDRETCMEWEAEMRQTMADNEAPGIVTCFRKYVEE